MRYEIVPLLPDADLGLNDPRRSGCDGQACEQLATVIYRLVESADCTTCKEKHTNILSQHRLCPTHTGLWSELGANPDNDQWVGRSS